jgi:hypothetical protein
MKTAAFLVIVGALTGCGPAPVAHGPNHSEVGRYQIYQARNPGDQQQVLVMKLDTVTGYVEQLDTALLYEEDADGYADTNRPHFNTNGSLFGIPYWRAMRTSLLEADSVNNYRAAATP